ncbi:unnamed protein product, partial [Ascophyllum nodosum]
PTRSINPRPKVRRFLKCGGIKGPESPRAGTPQGIYIPCECRASPDPGYRPPKTHLTIISGEVRRSKNRWRASTTPKLNCIIVSSHIKLVCVQGETAQIP